MKVGIFLDKKPISKILREFRRKGKVRTGLTWSQFIKNHLDSLVASARVNRLMSATSLISTIAVNTLNSRMLNSRSI